MCSTCPFRAGSPYESLALELAESALTNASRICHQTGTNAIGGVTGKPNRICRGARNVQLTMLAASGFLEAPTDEAWDNKCREMNIEPDRAKETETENPEDYEP